MWTNKSNNKTKDILNYCLWGTLHHLTKNLVSKNCFCCFNVIPPDFSDAIEITKENFSADQIEISVYNRENFGFKEVNRLYCSYC